MQTTNHRQSNFPKPDEAAEKFIISCLINSPDESLDKVRGHIPPEAFRLPRHRNVVDAICRLHDQREPTDFLSLQQHLFNTGGLNPSEDTAWFTEFLTQYCSPHDLHRHIEKLKKNHVASRLWILGKRSDQIFHTIGNAQPLRTCGRDPIQGF